MNPEKTSRYFRMTPEQRTRIKQRQKERYRENPYVQRRRMYLRACEKGLIRCPKKLDQYDNFGEADRPINNNIGAVINGEAEEEEGT